MKTTHTIPRTAGTPETKVMVVAVKAVMLEFHVGVDRAARMLGFNYSGVARRAREELKAEGRWR